MQNDKAGIFLTYNIFHLNYSYHRHVFQQIIICWFGISKIHLGFSARSDKQNRWKNIDNKQVTFETVEMRNTLLSKHSVYIWHLLVL